MDHTHSSGPTRAGATTGHIGRWRGTYTAAFPTNITLGYLYPTVGFALWHLAPQTVVPSSYPGGALSFLAGADLWGLLYGWVAWHTRSIRLTTLSHILLDVSGLGARIYLA